MENNLEMCQCGHEETYHKEGDGYCFGFSCRNGVGCIAFRPEKKEKLKAHLLSLVDESFDDFAGRELVEEYFKKMFMIFDGKLPITFFRNNMTEDEKLQVVNWTIGEVMKALAPEKTQKEKLKQIISQADFSKFENNN